MVVAILIQVIGYLVAAFTLPISKTLNSTMSSSH
jgi:hypothetical protein